MKWVFFLKLLFSRILAQFLHVVKLLADAFIYARRLIEIKYAIFVFNQKTKHQILRKLRIRQLFSRKSKIYKNISGHANEKEQTYVPPEFQRYLIETKENRSVRSKRVKSEFQSTDKKRAGSEKQKRPATKVTSCRTSPNGSKVRFALVKGELTIRMILNI